MEAIQRLKDVDAYEKTRKLYSQLLNRKSRVEKELEPLQKYESTPSIRWTSAQFSSLSSKHREFQKLLSDAQELEVELTEESIDKKIDQHHAELRKVEGRLASIKTLTEKISTAKKITLLEEKFRQRATKSGRTSDFFKGVSKRFCF